ncbi:hypothetical protein FA09DRAFT_332262 [Tilletiopsis washingtonensis]|uniref:ER membrane protein complex subunit 10 n=1 Tax=Tilletiopsis washingtonensis TaxID=58919 RepID=A0A316Z1C2_9BASI|nr:hypothetical protein FA09DRAFT_332262 [Tilletiopsis washingtonensis]PWN95369.1 hypothetical protein FA09DRAFT_332262 [Tilletiopsis washingtonensis]
MVPSLSVALSALLALSALVVAESPAPRTYTLLHRHLSASASPAWQLRGHVSLEPSLSALHGVDALLQAQAQPHEVLHGDKGWYQVLLQPGDVSPGGSNVPADAWLASTRACHLPSSQALTLHLPPLGAANSGSVRALSLQTLDLASDELDASGCPRVPRVAGAQETQTQLHVVRAGGAGTPPPRPPPVLKPDGTPLADGEAPPKEKSFVQKYWWALGLAVIMLAIPSELADSGETEEGGDAMSGPRLGGSSGAGAGPAQAGGGMKRIR